MSTQQDIYDAGSETRPPMLNKENYVPWSSRHLGYTKSKPNGKLLVNLIKNGPYVRRIIHELGDPNAVPPVAASSHEQTDDELTHKKAKQVEADDQAIQTILMGLPEDIYICHHGYLYEVDYTQLYDFLKFNQAEVNQIRAEQLARSHDPLALMVVGNQNGYSAAQNVRNQIGHGKVVAAWADGNVNGNNGNQIRCYNCRGLGHLAKNYTQASTSGIQIGSALVYDSDGTSKNNSNAISDGANVEQSGGTVDQNPATAGEVHAHFESLYNNLVTQVEKVNQTFLKDVLENSRPLTKLLEKDATFEFSDECRKALELLKEKLTCALVIIRPNWNLPFELMCDASDFAILLLQEFDLKIRDRKGTENVAASHLFWIDNDETSDDSKVDDNFPGETLMRIDTRNEQWFADLANYLVRDIIPKGMMYQQKNKFFSDLKYYFWEDPYLFKLSKEKSVVSRLEEDKKKLKFDFKIREDELLDKQIELEKKIKELDNILLKHGQSIQTMHMLTTKPYSFYHTEQKMALDKHDPPVMNDSEETLQLAQESRLKMQKLNKEIQPANYEKINKLSEVFVSQKAKSREEMYFSNTSKTANVSTSFSIPNDEILDDTSPSVARKFLKKEEAKFVRDFKSLEKEADDSPDRIKVLEKENDFLLRAVVSQDIMSIVQNNSIVDTCDLQTELDRTKEQMETCIIKMEKEYIVLWNDCHFKLGTFHTRIEVVQNDKVIALGMFRINPFKTCREEKPVPKKPLRVSVRTKPIIVSQPSVIHKENVNSNLNGSSSTGVDNTAKNRRPQPRSIKKNDMVPSVSISSCLTNKDVEVQEHHRNLLLSKNKKHISSESNHDVCVLNYVNGINSRDDEPMWTVDRVVAPTLGSAITLPATANEFAIKDTEYEVVRLMMFPLSHTGDAKTWLDELAEGTMTADENSESETEEEPEFEKITINTDYKIKTSLEEPPTNLELKPLPDNLEYLFLEEPSFLPIIISSQLSALDKSKLISVLKKHLLGKQQTFLILLLQEFDLEIRDRKGTENVDADHLSWIDNDEKSDDSKVDDNFPRETLMRIDTRNEQWFADFANYLVGDIIPKGMTY
ncbi:retrovirus-related pol polyprotein from transposon TNT 1-94 [Tanacetum coccineum]